MSVEYLPQICQLPVVKLAKYHVTAEVTVLGLHCSIAQRCKTDGSDKILAVHYVVVVGCRGRCLYFS